MVELDLNDGTENRDECQRRLAGRRRAQVEVRVRICGVGLANLEIGMIMHRRCHRMLVHRGDGCLRHVFAMSPGVAELGSEERESEEKPQNWSRQP